MRILIDMGHPGHVHLFRNFIWEMQKRGHSIKVIARDKDVTRQLLEAYHIPYELVGKPLPEKFSLVREWIQRTLKIISIGRKFHADVYIGVLNPATAIAALINRKYSLTFNDTEHAEYAKRITYPFTDCILTPSSHLENIGQKQIRYNGFHELAYLHPKYFSPDPAILDETGLKKDDPYIILRFVSWRASHDVGHSGIENKADFVHALEQFGCVLITSETALPPELERHRLQISPEKLHDLISYATLCIGEGGTIATESAILGTPSIYVSSLAGTMGNFIELEKKYDLMFSYKDSNHALEMALKILQDPGSKEKWRDKRQSLLDRTTDVTAFMVSFVEDFSSDIDGKKLTHRSE